MANTEEKSKPNFWLYTAISFVIMLALLIIITPWFWVALPFFLTFLVKAMGLM